MTNQIPFREYMNKWLYDVDSNNQGYYLSSDANRIGKSGDFYTSVSVSKFFGGAIARYIIALLEKDILSLPLAIIEIGSNNADLIGDVAEFLSAFSYDVINQCEFCTIEPLPNLRILQKQNFESRITNRFKKQLHIFKRLQDIGFVQNIDKNTLQHSNNILEISKQKDNTNTNIFFLSNELFDSMPCDVIMNEQMLFVRQDSNNHEFIWQDIQPSITDFRNKYKVLGSEVCLNLEKFIYDINMIKNKWIFLAFDYGEFGARDMNLRIYQKHYVYNFYEELQNGNIHRFYKQSDITYDVDFGILQNIFAQYGAKCLFCSTQAKALLQECNILEVFELFSQGFSLQTKIKQQVKLKGLIAPNAMGERFKAICFIGGE
ncbi:hypothetical protein LS73_006865 [Helicobacter muridarum]|uniref:SAM-dependent methyltransferase n=1 Tax=Helicobacter muridarum TaxID=216 RepID=A0A099TWP0_9HELI|nr:SAM-dependent methyltransferase [Helicobacter muridarum]TLD99786.1 hypothetical protein LS73_006865 [Helicobacter muridarum]STQ86980.1 SAM-dependent methyltransferase [Helicobacter muridarum]